MPDKTAAWDSNLITKTVWAWGSYVDRLEAGWLKSQEAAQPEVLPILDRQLGVAGLRLARFLNDAYGSKQCPAQ